MKKTKYLIGFLLLFMIVGFAAISVTLSIRGTTRVAATLDDFKVYFSNVLIDGEQDFSVVRNETELYFDILIEEVGDTHNIVYDVTNGSKYYDAQLSINCTTSNEYLNIVNNIDTSTNLLSKETRQGTLSLTKIKTIASDTTQDNTITCKLTATPVERNSVNNNSPATPVDPYYIGREVSIGNERFNIISWDNETVTMLAKYNLGTDYRQNTTMNLVTFYDANNNFDISNGPKEIDLQTLTLDATTYINEYASYLQNETGHINISGNLITLSDLKKLGCTIQDDYSWTGNETCANSPYKEWLITEQYWWTRSIVSSGTYDGCYRTPWYVNTKNSYNQYNLGDSTYEEGCMLISSASIRPTITISKELYLTLIDYYKTGREVTIGNEKFNVIKDNGTTITMLAQYNLGTDYRQSTYQSSITFSDSNGWDYGIPPKDIDVQSYDGDVKTYINAYVDFLKTETGNELITGDLISLYQLETLDFDLPDDWSTNNGIGITTSTNKYKSWFINGQNWWTKAAGTTSDKTVYIISADGSISSGYYTSNGRGVRPVITISKDAI